MMFADRILSKHAPAFGLLSLLASAAPAQTSSPTPVAVPVRELSTPTAAPRTFRNILNVREIANGGVLVNDALSRQVVLLDNRLTGIQIVLDSIVDNGRNGYGALPTSMIPYLADSTFFVDRQARALLVIDPNGKVVRSSAAPVNPREFNNLTASVNRTDHAGNILFRAVTGTPSRRIGDTTSRIITEESRQPDSTYIIRANFDLRTTDTIARLKQVGGMRSVRTRSPEGQAANMRVIISPIETLDDWATLADGSVAVVRGGDYHVDFLRRDGKWESGAKMPFDWKPISDADKQRIIDSTRAAIEDATNRARESGGPEAARNAQRDAIIGNLTTLPGAAPVTATRLAADAAVARGQANAAAQFPLIPYEFVPLGEMPSYYPPLRMGFTTGDADGNLWILPTTSAQSKQGELVYDVVSGKGVLIERVRLPVGRLIAGFGRGGVVYLSYRDKDGAWHLERTRVLRSQRAG